MKKQMTEKLNKNKGITLIALVITIIVMLILVAVTITMAVNGGLFEYAGNAVGDTNNAMRAEGQLGSGQITVDNQVYSSIDQYLESYNVETISKATPYVGYYADLDGVDGVDGIIYADLAVGNTGDGQWGETEEGKYTIPIETGLKDYYIAGTYEGIFGEKEVLKSTGSGKDRFYVMALNDVDTNSHTGYYHVSSEIAEGQNKTLSEFGTGKKNTELIKEIWDNGQKYNGDVWGTFEKDSIWFVPSNGEWAAFFEELKIPSDGYGSLGFQSRFYWTSTFATLEYFTYISKSKFSYNDGDNYGYGYARLSTTF